MRRRGPRGRARSGPCGQYIVPPMKNAPHRLPGLVLEKHWFDLPLDYAHPDRKIRVFVREAVAAGKESADLLCLVFFQGGPGFGSPRPVTNSGWIKRALQDYRVLLLDQRGTGLSSSVTAQSLRSIGDARAQAEYLRHFRSDNIVRDAEAIRRQLVGDRPWSILGQSYGGFCALRYLSASPEGVEEGPIAGGIPALPAPADGAHRPTYPHLAGNDPRYHA